MKSTNVTSNDLLDAKVQGGFNAATLCFCYYPSQELISPVSFWERLIGETSLEETDGPGKSAFYDISS